MFIGRFLLSEVHFAALMHTDPQEYCLKMLRRDRVFAAHTDERVCTSVIAQWFERFARESLALLKPLALSVQLQLLGSQRDVFWWSQY
jgi:hypothetical protein